MVLETGPETAAACPGHSGAVRVGPPSLQVIFVPVFTFEMVVVPATVIEPETALLPDALLPEALLPEAQPATTRTAASRASAEVAFAISCLSSQAAQI